MCDSKHMLLGLSDGSLYSISWKGEVISLCLLNALVVSLYWLVYIVCAIWSKC